MPTLGKVGIVDKGNYSASATYNSGDFVTYNGSTFLAIKDGVKGIAPSDDKTNWKYLAKGFNEPAASGITVTDTHGIIDGSKGKKTFAQNLFDGIGNWIITKAVTNDTFVNKLTERLINNGTATLEGFALDARQGNPTVEGSLAKQISKLNEEAASLLFENAGAHNAIYRGKNLGNSVTSAQHAAISSGKFTDLYIGDYWTIGGRIWRIVDMDYWYNCGDTAFTSHHLVIMPDEALYNAQMNTTNVTTGGYVGSEMYKKNLENAKTIINAAFQGSVLTHREYLCNAVANGRPSGGAWFDSSIELPNEPMMYGHLHFSPTSDGSTVPSIYTISKTQLALFMVCPRFIVNRSYNQWLRDVVSSARFAIVDLLGNTNCTNASLSYGVRPVFCIG